MLKLRKAVRKFSDFMESKLRKNDHRDGWSHSSNEFLLSRLQAEVDELHESVRQHDPPMIIAQEAADVANFAMMLADNAGALKPDYPLTLGDTPKPQKGAA